MPSKFTATRGLTRRGVTVRGKSICCVNIVGTDSEVLEIKICFRRFLIGTTTPASKLGSVAGMSSMYFKSFPRSASFHAKDIQYMNESVQLLHCTAMRNPTRLVISEMSASNNSGIRSPAKLPFPHRLQGNILVKSCFWLLVYLPSVVKRRVPTPPLFIYHHLQVRAPATQASSASVGPAERSQFVLLPDPLLMCQLIVSGWKSIICPERSRSIGLLDFLAKISKSLQDLKCLLYHFLLQLTEHGPEFMARVFWVLNCPLFHGSDFAREILTFPANYRFDWFELYSAQRSQRVVVEMLTCSFFGLELHSAQGVTVALRHAFIRFILLDLGFKLHPRVYLDPELIFVRYFLIFQSRPRSDLRPCETELKYAHVNSSQLSSRMLANLCPLEFLRGSAQPPSSWSNNLNLKVEHVVDPRQPTTNESRDAPNNFQDQEPFTVDFKLNCNSIKQSSNG
ncbi:hypothetical protein B0H13DRAFT_1904665 [Mycena leptocephala]|nr:hypothetical protein B0H13DRAFT_1904665 [Mycena leptocephala]